MNEHFTLPGAEEFAAYLRRSLDGVLTAHGPVEVTNRHVEHSWAVCLNGAELGTYKVRYRNGNTDPTDAKRYYSGRIPGYVNPSARDRNENPDESLRPNPLLDVTLVSLVFEYCLLDGKSSYGWRRQGGHREIPFP